MKIPISWLKEYITFNETKEVLQTLFTTHSQEVESVDRFVKAQGLVIGFVKTCIPHPQSTHLSVCQVDIKTEVLQIVCGAPNVEANQRVIVAVPGAILPGNIEILKTEIRGIESYGMICSLNELGLEQKFHHEEGIHVINEDIEIGTDALKALYLEDEIIILDLTPNRADLLSIHGVAYDLAALINKEVKIPIPIVSEIDEDNPIKISSETASCKSYYGRIIKNMKIKPSPQWMRARLIAAGIRPINNIVDITNYVMLETGQPLHAFDYDKLSSDVILVKNALEGQRFITLDDKERILTSGDILITDGVKPIALGGVMGGAETEVTALTTSILLESAVFDYKAIRKTSHRLELRSESSLRFERKVNPDQTKFALERATELLIQYAEGVVLKGIGYFDNHEKLSNIVTISMDKINQVLGSNHTIDTVKTLLNRLHFDFKMIETTFHINLPTRRQDLEDYQDIIEEIGRLSGYNNLPNTLPKTESAGFLTPLQRFRRNVRYSMSGLGFHEVIGYTLTDEKSIHQFTRTKHNNIVQIANPMSENRSVLILTPINHLLEIMSYNVARQKNDCAIFELAKSYQEGIETEVLAIALTGNYHNYYWQTTPQTDFYTLKSVFEAFLNAFGINDITYEKTALSNYHPHQIAIIKRANQVIGHIGKIHPKTASTMDLKEVFVLEVELHPLFEATNKPLEYKIMERYPSVSRDIAVIVHHQLNASSLLDTIKEVSGSLLKSVQVFDVYQGDQLDNELKSIGIRMVFVDADKTLETQEVDTQIKAIVNKLKEKYSAKLR